jgi:hypothetical protein
LPECPPFVPVHGSVEDATAVFGSIVRTAPGGVFDLVVIHHVVASSDDSGGFFGTGGCTRDAGASPGGDTPCHFTDGGFGNH